LGNFGLIGGFTHQATHVPPAIYGPFCIAYLWQQILKSCLKKLRNPVMLPILWDEIGAGLGPPALGALSACQRIAAWRGPSTPKRSP